LIFDTHTHLNVPEFVGIEEEVIKRAKDLAVTEMAIVGFDENSVKSSLNLAEKYSNLYSIIGWHPTEAKSYHQNIEKWLFDLIATNSRVVGVGEIGLDYHWMKDSQDIQEKLFRRQIAIARELKKPITIHTRDAMDDTYRILRDEGVENGGIMHSFSGNLEWMKKFIDLGMHISFSGVVTFKKAVELAEAAKNCPQNWLLVETDAPYLTPVPFRGKRNEPGYTRYVVEKIAKLKNVPWEEVARQTTQNAHNLFRLTGVA